MCNFQDSFKARNGKSVISDPLLPWSIATWIFSGMALCIHLNQNWFTYSFCNTYQWKREYYMICFYCNMFMIDRLWRKENDIAIFLAFRDSPILCPIDGATIDLNKVSFWIRCWPYFLFSFFLSRFILMISNPPEH